MTTKRLKVINERMGDIMDPHWINVALVKDFPPGHWEVVVLEDQRILVVNVAGEFFAIEDTCSHDGGVLSEGGKLTGDEFVCPRHGARFCVRTGEVTAPPAYENIHTFSVRVENGMVQVGLTLH